MKFFLCAILLIAGLGSIHHLGAGEGRDKSLTKGNGETKVKGKAANGKPLREIHLEDFEGPLTAVAFSTDRKWVLTGSLDGTVRIWDLEEKAKPRLLGGIERKH